MLLPAASPEITRLSKPHPAFQLYTLAFCFFLAALCFPGAASAADSHSYLSQILLQAERDQLAERPEWRALLHYQPHRFSAGVESEVDEPGFFLSPVGKKDPRAELKATLEGFFKTEASAPDDSVQCRYVARYHWLSQELHFDERQLPQLPCNRFHKWFEEMHPGRITLVFPAAYLNNPASMFGHTLMRIDPQESSKEPPLLAYTVNYAAETRQQRGAAYAVKGLFGAYHGRYSIAPYYSAVKSYGDIENRDIWEFGLDLDREEIAQLLRHVWEMRAAWFDYYFLDENCSYELLSLVEVARPTLRLTSRFHGWTIPSETVRVLAEAGLVRDVRFRPARSTVLKERMRRLESGQQELARRLSLGEVPVDADQLTRLAPVQQAQVVELALDYTAYRQSRRFGGAESGAGKASDLLLLRSRLDVLDQTPAIAAPKVWPGNGHKPARAQIGYGVEHRQQFVEVAGSPAYHDFLDPEGGYTKGGRVDLLRAAVRYYPETAKVELEQLDIIDIMSLSSWNRLLHPVSWKIALGAERKWQSATESLLLGKFNTGVGLSHDLSPDTTAYAFAEGTVEVSDRFDFFLAPGVGPRLGILHDFSDRWRTAISFSEQFFFLHESRNDYRAALETRLTVNEQNIAGVDVGWKQQFSYGFPFLKLYWQHYF